MDINIKTTFNSFNNKTILIVGDVMIDAYMWGKVDRISPEAPIPIVSVNNRENRLGGAANVALNVKELGANAIICSVIGIGEKAEIFLNLMRENNLSTSGIVSDSRKPTSVKTRIISEGQHLLRIDEEDTSYINGDLESSFILYVENIISKNNIDAIIFQDYDKGVLSPKIITSIIKIANIKEIPTLVDPKKRNFLSYKNVTLFKPNFKELKEGLNLSISKSDTNKLYKVVSEIHESWNVKYVFTTLSEYGVFISDINQHHIIPAEIRQIADVSGAGDTVIAVASLCLACKLNMQQIAYLSNIAGGLVCEEVGVVPINKDKFMNEISSF